MEWALETEAVVRKYALDSLKGKEKEKAGQDGGIKYLWTMEKKNNPESARVNILCFRNPELDIGQTDSVLFSLQQPAMPSIPWISTHFSRLGIFKSM